MTILRLISPALRSALLLATGLGLITVPLFIGLEAAAVTTALVVGVLMVALALAGTETSGRGTLPVSAQAVYDRGLAVGLMAVASVVRPVGRAECDAPVRDGRDRHSHRHGHHAL